MRRFLVPAILVTCVALVTSPGLGRLRAEAVPGPEVRGLWVVRTALTTPASIDRMVEGARAAGFNTLLVQVRGRGDAYYTGGLEPRATALSRAEAAFDPLARTIAAARPHGLRVLAWINVNLVSSAQDLPSDPRHIVNRAPDWLMVPRALAQDLSVASPTSPGYVGRLARWSRANVATVEGLYASPLHPDAVRHAIEVTSDIARRYPIDGVHFDYVRFPGAEFDYGRAALDGFRAATRADVPAATARSLDTRRADDALAWVDAMPERWEEFRRTRLTAFVNRLRSGVLAARPGLLVTAAVVADPSEARRKLQDWRRWLDLGLIDVACPMAYTPDDAVFAQQIGEAVQATTTGAIWAGIGAYRLTPDQTVARIATARRAGAEGIVLFSYDSIVEASPATFLDEVGRGAFPEPRVPGSR